MIALLFPMSVFAENYKVIDHVIDSEVEIAGALSVKELITIEGDTDSFFRKLNYYSFGDCYTYFVFWIQVYNYKHKYEKVL